VGSIDRRLDDLEGHFRQPDEDHEAELQRARWRAILNEFAGLKASRAVHYCANKRVEPEDIPGKILGPGYTTGEVWELAARRVFEREREIAPEILSEEDIEEMFANWTASSRRFFEESGYDWHKVEDAG
jgi:hypothetical protein